MSSTYFRFLLVWAVGFFGMSMLFSQSSPFPNTFNKPPTPPDSVKLPTMQDRIDELKKAGLTDEQINAYLKPDKGEPAKTGTPTAPIQQPPPSAAVATPTSPEQNQSPQGMGKNPPFLLLYNDASEKIDTFWTSAEWQRRMKNTDQRKKQREYEEALTDPSTLFGHHLFIKDDFTRSDSSAYSPPDDYVVQPGDKFFVQITGPAELFEQLEVDKDGTVFRQYVGKKAVGGVTYREAKKILENGYRKVVPDKALIQINLTKNKGSISVNVVGEVKAPGTYTLPSVTNVISAIFAANGISDLGSVRSIMVKRAGKTIGEIDLYDYLIKGNTSQIYLKNNDYVYIPMQKAVVQVTGGVKRPMRYEIKEGESIRDVIKFAGGLNYDASLEKGQIARLEGGKDVLLDLDLQSNMDKKMQDGDQLRIKSLYRRNDAVAQIAGQVKYPGTYHWVKGQRVRDLIEIAGGTTKEAYLEKAYITRVIKPGELTYIPVSLEKLDDTTHNVRIEYLDQLMIFNKVGFHNNKISVVLQGKVKNPGTFEVSKNSTLKDLFYLSGGLSEEAEKGAIQLSYVNVAKEDVISIVQKKGTDTYVFRLAGETTKKSKPLITGTGLSDSRVSEITDSLFFEHLPKSSTFTKIVSLDPEVRWQDNPLLDTFLIRDFRFVSIYAKKDFLRPLSTIISGAVQKTQDLIAADDMTLKDALFACGGIAPDAYAEYIDLYLRMEDNQKGNFGLKSPEKEVYRVRVSKDWRNDPKFDSILVKPFYQIIVHDQGEFLEKGQIMVKGLVRKGGTFEYKPQMTLKDAIYEAGGIKIESDFSKIEVSRILDVENTNGEIVPLNVKTISVSIRQDWQSDPQLEGIKLLPFDQIFIRPNPEFKMQQSVFVDGEVLVPGEYIKSKVDLRISDLVAMSGGLTKLSYPEGAYLTRPSYGQITIALRNAIEKPGSIYDIKLQEGDVLTVPVLSEIVSVKGNVFKPNANFLFEPSRRNAKYYINMAGGFETKTIKRKVVVTYPNGRVKKAKTFFFFLHKYPKVTQGAIVDVPKREDKELTELDTERKFALKERINEIIATTTSIITLLVLIKAASK